jgi:hypothetical protein
LKAGIFVAVKNGSGDHNNAGFVAVELSSLGLLKETHNPPGSWALALGLRGAENHR